MIDKLIANRVFDLRKVRNMTQSELGEKIGVSAQQIVKYETASNRISASRLILIARALNKDISYFYTEFQTCSQCRRSISD